MRYILLMQLSQIVLEEEVPVLHRTRLLLNTTGCLCRTPPLIMQFCRFQVILFLRSPPLTMPMVCTEGPITFKPSQVQRSLPATPPLELPHYIFQPFP